MRVLPAHSGAVALRHQGLKLVGVLARPRGPENRKFPGVLFLHGFPGSEQNVDIRRALLERGVASFALHFSGAWGSEGNYSFSQLVAQASAGLRYLASRPFVHRRRLAVFGFSMGGWTAINLASRARVKAAAAVAPVGGPEMTRGLRRSHIAHMARTLRVESVDDLTRDFARCVTERDPAAAAARLRCPLLLVHGTADDVVPCGVSRRLYAAANKPKRLVEARGALHDFLDRRPWLTRLVVGFLVKELR